MDFALFTVRTYVFIHFSLLAYKMHMMMHLWGAYTLSFRHASSPDNDSDKLEKTAGDMQAFFKYERMPHRRSRSVSD